MSQSASNAAANTSAKTQPVHLLDISRGYNAQREELIAAVTRVCDSGKYIFGPDCTELEQTVAKYSGAKHGIACASGSDALLLALMALDLQAGDEVIIPSFTFFATAGAVWRLGAKPVFVDIDPVTFNMNPKAVQAAISARTKAIIPVHLFGQCADMQPIMEIANGNGLTVIEDSAQAIGAGYRGQKSGSIGHMGCLSFYPTKNLGGFGDGGMLTTNDDKLADKLKLLRGHGMQPRYYHSLVGINSRLDSIQAAILNVRIKQLPQWETLRRENAARYASLFNAAGLDEVLTLPTEAEGCRHVWNQYTVRINGSQRDALRNHLAASQIGTEIYYPLPLHRQDCFRSLNYGEGSLPETEKASLEVMSLPIYPELTEAEQKTVVAHIAGYFDGIAANRSHHALKGPNFLRAGQGARKAS